ncbi:uncharacterized protein [Amphiura filiformis]|uniref:uncharacterized protein n=1 Tax=Amphiura filiformis TaxID=82378 RepID=UPI003B21BAC0
MKILSTILIVVLFITMAAGYPDALTRETNEDAPDAQAVNKRSIAWFGTAWVCETEHMYDVWQHHCEHRSRLRDVKDALGFLKLRGEDNLVKQAPEAMREECCEEQCSVEEVRELDC